MTIKQSRCTGVLVSVLLLGLSRPVHSQVLADSATLAATQPLRPAHDFSKSQGKHLDAGLPADTTVHRRSRLGAAALGFLAGAATGLVIAHIVNQNQNMGEGKLENYFGIPLALGVFTFATIFVAMGD
jgi:hypothetical protein